MDNPEISNFFLGTTSNKNIRDNLVYNPDASIDLYFGPTPPEGKEENWTQTLPSQGWFAILRMYEPLEPWLDKTWQPGDFERIG